MVKEERVAVVDDASMEPTKFVQAPLVVIALTTSLAALSFVAKSVLDLSTLA